jgi:hypothetical protein
MQWLNTSTSHHLLLNNFSVYTYVHPDTHSNAYFNTDAYFDFDYDYD